MKSYGGVGGAEAVKLKGWEMVNEVRGGWTRTDDDSVVDSQLT